MDKDNDIASLPVQLVFQAGQVEVTVSEVDRLAPGRIIPLDRSVEDCIDIVANGKRIGQGGLVKVGGMLAVRVSRLNPDA